jgi:beta-barrel assembly-enhancing protease
MHDNKPIQPAGLGTSRSQAFLSLVLATLLLAGCATSGGGGDLNLVSLEDEWKLGEQLAADIEKNMEIVHDREVNGLVNRIGQQIVRQTAMAQLPWHFHVVNDPQINAFNIPGGRVYVTTGLIAAAKDVAAFSSVLAHEIAHGVSRHGTEQLTRSYGLSVVANLLLGNDPALHEQVLAGVLGSGAMAHYSRQAELEADSLGLRCMVRAGYDPNGMIRMFETLLEDRKRRPSRVERIFATHPLTEDRILAVRNELQTLPETTSLVASDREYERIHRRFGG